MYIVAVRVANGSHYWSPVLTKKAPVKLKSGRATRGAGKTAKKRVLPTKKATGKIFSKELLKKLPISYSAGSSTRATGRRKTPAKKRSVSSKSKRKTLSTLDFYTVRSPDKPNWALWMSQYPVLQIVCNKIRHELRAIGIDLYVVPNPYDPEAQAYWVDYVWDYVREKYPESQGRPQLIGNLKLDVAGKRIAFPELDFQHTGIGVKEKNRDQVVEIFRRHLGKRFQWNGRCSKVLRVILR
jgi:hypothetical protein